MKPKPTFWQWVRATVEVACALVVLFALNAQAQTLDPLKEYRYAGPPVRNVDGTIRRRADVIAAFRKVHRCPSTGRYTGACPNYAINHVYPLACGGADAVWNMVWMRNDIKAQVDRIERRISAAEPPIEDTAACKFQITP